MISLLEKYPYIQQCLDCVIRDITSTNLYIWNSTHYAPSLKQQKGAKLVIAYGSLSPDEEVFFSQDMTLFNDGEIGCVVTDKYLYYKDRWEYPIRMSYKNIDVYYGNGCLQISGEEVTALQGNFPDERKIKFSLSSNRIDAINSITAFICAMSVLHESDTSLTNDELISKSMLINEERVKITNDKTVLDVFFDKYIFPYENEIETMLRKVGSDGNIEMVIDKVIDFIPAPARYVVPRSLVKKAVLTLKDKMFG